MKILITGSDGSLGRTLCEEAARRGFDLVALTMEQCENLRDLRAAMRPTRIHDVTHMILNHSVNFLSPLGAPWAAKTDVMSERMLRANVLVPREAVSLLAEHVRHPVRVLFITSQAATVTQRTTSLYGASKAAQNALMRVASRELAPRGWAVNALAPGKIVDTRMSEMTDAQVLALRGWSSDDADKYAISLIPAGRHTTRAEVTEAAFKLLDMPLFMTGTVISMTGGV